MENTLLVAVLDSGLCLVVQARCSEKPGYDDGSGSSETSPSWSQRRGRQRKSRCACSLDAWASNIHSEAAGVLNLEEER